MPPSTRPSTPGPSSVPQLSKHTMSDPEPAPQLPKKPRRNSSAEGPSTTRDAHRDTKRRRRKRKKAPVVSSASKDEAALHRPDGRTRAPLSARNEIIRFTSAEADTPAGAVVPSVNRSSQVPSSKTSSQSRQRSSHTLGDPAQRRGQGMASTLNGKGQIVPPSPELFPGSLEEKMAQLEAQLESKNNLIASHQALLNQVQQAITCQVCLDLMYKPYALAPCGHLACHSCLVNWFTAPPPDHRPVAPAIRRRKTCPHCRAVVRERPIEVWGVKAIAQAAGKSGLLPNQIPVSVEAPGGLDANADPWKDIFPKPGAATHRGFSWFFPDANIDDDDVHIADAAPRGEDVGMLDIEDGGIYRCLDCMHEIWGGVCSSCGRVYPGHTPGGDEEEGDPMGWLENRMGAEEVDVADDPGWMGLEDGEADDDGDTDDWRPFAPWGRRFRTFGRPWGFLGTIHVDEEDQVDTFSGTGDFRVGDEYEGSEDDGYESSFIDDDDDDDDDEGGGFAEHEGGPRIYEIGDDNDEAYQGDQRSRIVDLGSDEGESSEVPGRGRAGHGHAAIVVSSDEEAVPSRHSRRWRHGPRFDGSDGSDAY